MKEKWSNDEVSLETLKRMAEWFQLAFPTHSEVNVIDLAEDGYPIVAVYGNHITGRNIGDKTSAHLHCEHDVQSVPKVMRYEWVADNGKRLTASCIIFKENGKARYAISINTNYAYMRDIIASLTAITGFEPQEYEKNDLFTDAVTDGLVENEIRQVGLSKNLDIQRLNKQDKKTIIKELKKTGFLHRRGVIPILCDILDVSRVTIYNYSKS